MKTFLVASLAFATFAASVAACSSTTSSTPENDAGPTDTDSSTESDAAPKNDATTTNEGGAVGTYCEEATKYFQRCNRTTACDVALLGQCNDVMATYSAAFQKANAECFPQLSCTPDNTNTCVRDKISQATPTAAQTKLAQDYCAKCNVVDGGDCVAQFYHFAAAAKDDAPTNRFIQASDTLVAKVGTDCVPSLAGASCESDFLDCGYAILVDSTPEDPVECNE